MTKKYPPEFLTIPSRVGERIRWRQRKERFRLEHPEIQAETPVAAICGAQDTDLDFLISGGGRASGKSRREKGVYDPENSETKRLDRKQLKRDARRYLATGTPRRGLVRKLRESGRYADFSHQHLSRVLKKIL